MSTKRTLVLFLLLVAAVMVMTACSGAEWAAVYYDVEFMNVDGSVYKSFVVQRHHGVECELNPNVRADCVDEDGQAYTIIYTQTGWDKATDDVISDMQVNPVVEIHSIEYNSHVVTFVVIDQNGEEIHRSQVVVATGEAATAPDVEIPEDYFIIWDKDFSCITESITVTGCVTVEYVDVIFDAGEGKFATGDSILHYGKIRYDEGIDLDSIEQPVLAHYVFDKWAAPVVENGGLQIRYVAEYKAETFTVTFLDKEGRTLKVIEDVEYGSSVADQAPEAPAVEHLVFVEWIGGDLDFIAGDTTFRPYYKGEDVTYIYYDIEGNELERRTIGYGAVPSDPVAPEVEGKTFIRWIYGEIQYNDDGKAFREVHPEYRDGRYYKVAFVVNGYLVDAQFVEEGKAPTDPRNLSKDISSYVPEGKQIVGWEYAVVNENGEIEYKTFDFANDVVTQNMTLRAVLGDK